jgi:hypothetical protein
VYFVTKKFVFVRFSCASFGYLNLTLTTILHTIWKSTNYLETANAGMFSMWPTDTQAIDGLI